MWKGEASEVDRGWSQAMVCLLGCVLVRVFIAVKRYMTIELLQREQLAEVAA